MTSTLWPLHSIYLFCTSSSEKRWKNPKRKISAWTLEDETCCHFPYFCCFSFFVTSRLTREKSFFSFSTICPGMQILFDRLICLQAIYNEDGGLDNKSRSPSPILVGVIVFWPCVKHLVSHTVVITLVSIVSITILFGESLLSVPDLTVLDTPHLAIGDLSSRCGVFSTTACELSGFFRTGTTFHLFFWTLEKKSSNTIPGQICCFFFLGGGGCSF